MRGKFLFVFLVYEMKNQYNIGKSGDALLDLTKGARVNIGQSVIKIPRMKKNKWKIRHGQDRKIPKEYLKSKKFKKELKDFKDNRPKQATAFP